MHTCTPRTATHLASLLPVLLQIAAPAATTVLDCTSVPGAALGDCMYPGDIGTITTNPAAAYLPERSGVVGSYTLLSDYARYNVLGYVERRESIGLGVLLAQQHRDGIEMRQHLGDTPTSGGATHTGILIALAGQLPYDITGGAAVKGLQSTIAGTASGWGIAADAGVHRRIAAIGGLLRHRLTLDAGLSARNVLALGPDYEGWRDAPPAAVRLSLGAALTLLPRYSIAREQLDYDTLHLRCDVMPDGPGIGVEYRRWNIAARAGWRAGTYAGYVLGLGYIGGAIMLDYTYTPMVALGLHSLSVGYAFGERHGYTNDGTPDELEDFLAAKARAERIYERYYREAQELVRGKRHAAAAAMLEKVIPIMPDRQDAASLLAVCRTAILTEQLAAIHARHTRHMAAGLYPDAYDAVLEAVALAPDEALTRDMLTAVRDADAAGRISTTQRQIIQAAEARAAAKISDTLGAAIARADYAGAERELRKLQLLQPSGEATHRLKRHLEQERHGYTELYVRKAMQYLRDGRLPDAYACIREAHRVSNDEAVRMQADTIRGRFRRPALYEHLYRRKLYYNAAAAFAADEHDRARAAWHELRSADPAFDADLLEQALIAAGVIRRELP